MSSKMTDDKIRKHSCRRGVWVGMYPIDKSHEVDKLQIEAGARCIAFWMLSAWMSLTVLMVTALIWREDGLAALISPVLATPFGALLTIEARIVLPTALFFCTCAATTTGVLMLALFG